MVVDSRAPGGVQVIGIERTWFGLGATQLEYGNTVRFTVAPQRRLYPEQFTIASSCSRASVLSIEIAGVEVLAAQGGIPAAFFEFQALAGPAVMWPPIGPDEPVTLAIWYPPASALTRLEHCNAFKLRDRSRFLWLRRLRSWFMAYVLNWRAPAPVFSGAFYGRPAR